MIFNALTFWNTEGGWGIGILDYDNGNENDEFTRALLGISYNSDEKKIYIDLFWKIFTI